MLPNFLKGLFRNFREKTAASPVTGNPAVSLLETRGFPSPPHGGFGFIGYLKSNNVRCWYKVHPIKNRARTPPGSPVHHP